MTGCFGVWGEAAIQRWECTVEQNCLSHGQEQASKGRGHHPISRCTSNDLKPYLLKAPLPPKSATLGWGGTAFNTWTFVEHFKLQQHSSSGTCLRLAGQAGSKVGFGLVSLLH